MVGLADTRWSSGQATVEHVGLALVLALVFGALGTWVVTGFDAPTAPPPVIERVAAPLLGGPGGAGGAAGPGARVAPDGPATGGAAPAQAAPEPAGTPMSPVAGMRGMARAMERAAGATIDGANGAAAADVAGAAAGERGTVRRIWDGLLWWGALNVDGQIEAGRGFLEQVGVRAEDLVKDPVKTIEGAIDRLSRPPVTSTADRVANIVRALSGLGDRPFRESFLGISRDLGGLGADWVIAKFARGAGELLGKLLGG